MWSVILSLDVKVQILDRDLDQLLEVGELVAADIEPGRILEFKVFGEAFGCEVGRTFTLEIKDKVISSDTKCK